MCLFLLAVEAPLKTKPLWPFRVSWQGLIWILRAVFFHSFFGRILFRLILFRVADGKLLFLCPSLNARVQGGGWCAALAFAPDIVWARRHSAVSWGAGDTQVVLSLVGAMSLSQHFLVSKQIDLSFKCKLEVTLFF